MSRPARILHTADSHIGAALPGRPRRSGRRRGDDLIDSFNRVLHRAAEFDVDLVIHSGDLFNAPNPGSRALAAASAPLLELAAAGVPVVIVPGNHERSAIPASLFLSHPRIHIVHQPATHVFRLDGTTVAVSAFPNLRRGAAQQFPESLAATGWERARADLRILAVHEVFHSAVCGPADYRFTTGDEVIPRSAVPAVFDYVAAGHIHRHQGLASTEGNGPSIVYSGSPNRISFAEIDEPKGCVLLEVTASGIGHRFCEHQVRPMSIWPIDVTGLTRSRILEEIETLIAALPPQAIAQLRLAGRCTAQAMRGLRLTATARRLRPDALITASLRDVEIVPARTITPASTESAFAILEAPPAASYDVSADDVARLPTGLGVYALHDADRRLLYVGKSKNVRSRVRTHLRGRAGASYFRGWTKQIARIGVRLADSELEALLIEAELIRRLGPPFNRQMRRWRDYHYLASGDLPFGQLEVRRQVDGQARCFGPFRSRWSAEAVRVAAADHFRVASCPDPSPRDGPLPLLQGVAGTRLCDRYFVDRCVGPCADRVRHSDYELSLRACDALLTGIDDTPLVALERQFEEVLPDIRPGGREYLLLRQAQTLRAAFEHCATLRQAEQLMGGLLLLPGAEGSLKTVTPTNEGLRFGSLNRNMADAGRVLADYADAPDAPTCGGSGRLPIGVVDGLCLAARQMARDPQLYRLIPRNRFVSLDGASLLDLAFGGPA
ncbi:MAG: GIY-YIG nuclease family protein [bacterium]|nr:GIY-YIG nuclease family protein [bacterium]